MHLVEGPFSHLYGRWEFQALGEIGCKITLKMEFDFSSFLLKKTLGPIFSKIVNTLVDAFIQRAGELYGKS
jgi:ribosome-associated toxin RatA of RatAB toxin-antitoxin module